MANELEMLDGVRKLVFAKGFIRVEDIHAIRTAFLDGKTSLPAPVGHQLAELLFEWNDAQVPKGDAEAWRGLFIDGICHYLFNDSESPGWVDENEWSWLLKRIEADGYYDPNEIALLLAIGERSDQQISLKVYSKHIKMLLEKQEEAYLHTLRALLKALEAKDKYTSIHSARVTQVSVEIGRHVGLSEQDLVLLKKGALMHDLGKIATPEDILNKSSGLSKSEFDIMRAHPESTAAILGPLKHLKPLTDIATSHHERWDGGGYPLGLHGDSIPLMARIVSVADTWDAMVGDRVYRKGIPSERAIAILRKERFSGQWDPELLGVLLTMKEKSAAQNNG